MGRKINKSGLNLVREFEGVKPKAYLDPVGILTVGVGHVVLPGDGIKLGERISDERVNDLLREDLATAEAGVEAAITEEITDNQFAACVSLGFNIGVSAFKKSSIVKYINAGDVTLAADRFLLYSKAGGRTLAGLTRRRKAERALYLKDDPDHIKNGEVAEAVLVQEAQQTVEAGGVGVSVSPAQAPEPVSKPEDKPIPVMAVEPLKSGAKKSIWATIIAAVTWVGLNIQDFFGRAYGAAQNNPMAVVALVCGSVAILVIYWKYQERQTRLDERRSQQAHELTLATMKLAADPQQYKVEVVKNNGT